MERLADRQKRLGEERACSRLTRKTRRSWAGEQLTGVEATLEDLQTSEERRSVVNCAKELQRGADRAATEGDLQRQ